MLSLNLATGLKDHEQILRSGYQNAAQFLNPLLDQSPELSYRVPELVASVLVTPLGLDLSLAANTIVGFTGAIEE